MAIVIAQSNVVSYQGTHSSNTSVILKNVSSGNSIVVVSMVSVSEANTPVVSVNDGNQYTDLTPGSLLNDASNSWLVTDLSILQSVSQGTHNVVSNIIGSVDNIGWCVAMDVGGLAGNALDISVSANNTATIGPTANPVETAEIAFALIT